MQEHARLEGPRVRDVLALIDRRVRVQVADPRAVVAGVDIVGVEGAEVGAVGLVRAEPLALRTRDGQVERRALRGPLVIEEVLRGLHLCENQNLRRVSAESSRHPPRHLHPTHWLISTQVAT